MLVVLELEVEVEWRLKIQDCAHCERARIAGTLKRKNESLQTGCKFASCQGCSETKTRWRASKVQGCRRPPFVPSLVHGIPIRGPSREQPVNARMRRGGARGVAFLLHV
jgi:hypothetical protein